MMRFLLRQTFGAPAKLAHAKFTLTLKYHSEEYNESSPVRAYLRSIIKVTVPSDTAGDDKFFAALAASISMLSQHARFLPAAA